MNTSDSWQRLNCDQRKPVVIGYFRPQTKTVLQSEGSYLLLDTVDYRSKIDSNERGSFYY